MRSFKKGLLGSRVYSNIVGRSVVPIDIRRRNPRRRASSAAAIQRAFVRRRRSIIRGFAVAHFRDSIHPAVHERAVHSSTTRCERRVTSSSALLVAGIQIHTAAAELGARHAAKAREDTARGPSRIHDNNRHFPRCARDAATGCVARCQLAVALTDVG